MSDLFCSTPYSTKESEAEIPLGGKLSRTEKTRKTSYIFSVSFFDSCLLDNISWFSSLLKFDYNVEKFLQMNAKTDIVGFNEDENCVLSSLFAVFPCFLAHE